MSTSEMTFKTGLISFKFPEHNLICMYFQHDRNFYSIYFYNFEEKRYGKC